MEEQTENRSARSRILDAAGALFYRQGFCAVGVDTIVARSGVAKMTLYRHFPSKDDLILAYLERAEERHDTWLSAAAGSSDDPGAQLDAIFQSLAAVTMQPECLGCTFQVAAAEFPDVTHPIHQRASAHKERVRQHLARLSREAGLCEPEALANALLLLMDGAWSSARVFGPGGPGRHVAKAARILIAAHTPAPHGGQPCNDPAPMVAHGGRS